MTALVGGNVLDKQYLDLIDGFTANVAHVPVTGVTVAFTSKFPQINSMEALGDQIIVVEASRPASNSGCETGALNPGSE